MTTLSYIWHELETDLEVYFSLWNGCAEIDVVVDAVIVANADLLTSKDEDLRTLGKRIKRDAEHNSAFRSRAIDSAGYVWLSTADFYSPFEGRWVMAA